MIATIEVYYTEAQSEAKETSCLGDWGEWEGELGNGSKISILGDEMKAGTKGW